MSAIFVVISKLLSHTQKCIEWAKRFIHSANEKAVHYLHFIRLDCKGKNKMQQMGMIQLVETYSIWTFLQVCTCWSCWQTTDHYGPSPTTKLLP